MKSTHPEHPSAAGLPADPSAFKALTEISIIAHLSDNIFAQHLPDGLTVAQFGVLNHLLRLKREETISELAAAMQVSQPTMSSTVRKLEEKGLIMLKAAPADRRVRRVCVTAAGQDIRMRSITAITPLYTSVSHDISEQDWEDVLPLLTRLRIVLDRIRS